MNQLSLNSKLSSDQHGKLYQKCTKIFSTQTCLQLHVVYDMNKTQIKFSTEK